MKPALLVAADGMRRHDGASTSESSSVMIDQFPHGAEEASRLRTLGLLAQADAGPHLVQHMRELLSAGAPQRRRIATSALTRDLSTANSGQFLVGTSTRPLEALLRRWSVLRDAGVTVVRDLQGNVTIPRIGTGASGHWLPADGTPIPTTGQPAFGQIALAAKYVACAIPVSRNLLLLSDAERIVGDIAGEALAKAIDGAVINGSGNLGEPLGIVATSGVASQSGTSLADAGLRAMLKAPLLADAQEQRLSWIGAPGVQELLGGRERAAGGGRFLWDDGTILGRPAVATSSCPAGTLIVGDWSRVTVGFFDGAGVGLEVDPYSDFRSGKVTCRLILPVDIGVSPAAAFAKASSIT